MNEKFVHGSKLVILLGVLFYILCSARTNRTYMLCSAISGRTEYICSASDNRI